MRAVYIGGALFGAGLVAAVGLGLALRKPAATTTTSGPEPTTTAAATTTAAPQKTQTPTPTAVQHRQDRVRDATTLAYAMALARPGDSDANDDTGTGEMVEWISANMSLAQLRPPKDEVTYGEAKKDIASARGKRVCWSGKIMAIKASKTSGGASHFAGRLMFAHAEEAQFFAVGSTGKLVEHDRAKFCGVVMGLVGYGGRMVSLVGMFDIADNR